ncbi:MAG: ribosome maturation factor RimM [Pseudomonadota bacterium]|jgi:16S rRNA processing protein RimM
MSGYLTLGQVAAPHGVRGGLKVNSFTEPPEALLAQAEWQLVAADGRVRDVKVRRGDAHRGQLRVELEGIADRDAAQSLAGWTVRVLRDRLPQPAQGEYFREDLIGLEVVNEEGVAMGRLDHFIDAPGGAVMVVKGAREHWIPAARPHLKQVDLAARSVLVDWPEEL